MDDPPGAGRVLRSSRWSTRRAGAELIVGCRRDPRFGPLVLVGLGGIYAELLRDVAVTLAPADADELEALAPSLSRSPACSRAPAVARPSTCAQPPRRRRLSHGSPLRTRDRGDRDQPAARDARGAVGLDARIVLGSAPSPTEIGVGAAL